MAIGNAVAAAAEAMQGQRPDVYRAEQRSLRATLRAIGAELEEIEAALAAVETLVVGEAVVVATTLTRAYKRDSVQARRFDTVILDETSMAPIPALWARQDSSQWRRGLRRDVGENRRPSRFRLIFPSDLAPTRSGRRCCVLRLRHRHRLRGRRRDGRLRIRRSGGRRRGRR